MLSAHCVCELIPRLTLSTRLSLVMHQREWTKTTNTGHLALQALTRSRLFLWGEEDQPPPPPDEVVPPGTAGYVLAPSGLPLTAERVATMRAGPPLTLVVTDGSWRQATKMMRRIPALAELPRLALPAGPPSRYALRSEPHPDGLATYEAIARALGLIEGDAVRRAMEPAFHAMVQRTLVTRGTPAGC
jgi:DTW domain-containing protein YfiP